MKALLPIVVTLLASLPARAELSAIWAVDDGTKVKADDLDHSLRASNEIFDGSKVRIFGMRNETVAFQLILRGGAAQTDAVTVELDAIGAITNSGVSNDPASYFIGRHIELFEQVYLNVTQRSKGLVWEPPTTGVHVPPGWTGPVPDALVPLNLRKEPLSVAANRNQGIWVDVYIPRDTRPGSYSGTATIKVAGKVCALKTCSIPVELKVINATLPDRAPVKTMLWFSGGDEDTVVGRYFAKPGNAGAAARKEIDDRHYQLARRHLVTLFVGHDKSPNNELKERMDGTLFTKARGYAGWGEGVGQNVYSIHTYGGKLTPSEAQTWSSWMKQNAPSADYFLYTWDEPGSGKFDQINQIAADAKPVPAFVTAHYRAALTNVDIFCALPDYYSMSKGVAEAKAAGKRTWIYNGKRPFSGSYAIDDTAVSLRVNPWIQFKYGIERWFYWESTYYYNFQAGKGQVNVWVDPLNFGNGSDSVNGDGLLFYPGRDFKFPAQDRGFDGPMPSIRLKNWRRGIQDIAYLNYLRDHGKRSEIDAALAKLVPKALQDETSNFKAASWPEDGETWVAERRKLAELLDSLGPPLPPAPDAGPSSSDAGVGPSDGGPADDAGRTISSPLHTGTLEGGCSVANASGQSGILLVLLGLAIWGRFRRR